MEQADKQRLWQIIGFSVLNGLCMAIARYERVAAPSSPLGQAIAEFFVVVGWLALAAAVILMLVWAVKSVRS